MNPMPKEGYRDAKGLHQEHAHVAAIKQTRCCAVAGRGKQANHERAERTAHTVHGHSADRIVNLELLVDKQHRADHKDTSQKADD